MNAIRVVFPITVLIIFSGCSSARYVMRDPDRGVVAIPSNSTAWPFNHRKKAEQMMQEHFPEGYVIDLEEETVVGKTTQFQENHDDKAVEVAEGVSVGSASASGSTTTTDKTEYRIFYRRR